MKEIKLSQNKIAIVDNDNYERLNRFKWYANYDGYNWYARRKINIDGKQKTIYMHREVMNVPKGVFIDHINGDSLDNRRENLRFCTNQQNQCNRDAQKNNKLGIKGIRLHEARKKFEARIKVNGKSIYLGYYTNLDDADSVYRKAEEKYFGKFARK